MVDILQIEITRNCNLKCKHCNRTKEHHGNIDHDVYKNLLELYKGQIEWVKLQGLGEPYLNPFINELAKDAISLGYKTMTITNGTIPIYESAFNKIIFSIDTLDESRYYNMRGFNINDVVNNLLSCKHNKWNVEVNCVKTMYNTPDDIEELKTFCKTNKIPINIVSCEVWVDPFHSDYNIFYHEAVNAHCLHNDTIIKGSRSSFCEWGITSLYYDYLGRLHPCCIRMTDDYIIDDIETYDYINCCKNCPL